MRYQTCVHCHTPIPTDRFECAHDGKLSFRICPECDCTTLWMIDEGDADLDPSTVLHAQRTDEVVE